MMAVLAGKLKARRADCAPVAGKSTLNRLELSRQEPTRYHKISHDPAAIEKLFVDLFLEAHERAAAADHPRSRRDRRPAARRAGGPLLPRLLRLLLLPAAVRVLRPPSAGGQAAAGEHRRGGGRGRGDGADRRANPPALAEGAHPAARRLRLCARGSDGLVRGQRRRLTCSVLPQNARLVARSPPIWRRPRRRAGAPASRRGASRISVVDARQLEPRAPRRRQGRMDQRRGQSALRRDLAQASRSEARISTRSSTARAARWRTASRSASSTSSPTAPRPPRCAPISCACGSPRWPMCCSARSAASACSTRQFADATCGTIRLKLLKIGALVRISVRRIKFAMASACPGSPDLGRSRRRLDAAASARGSPA